MGESAKHVKGKGEFGRNYLIVAAVVAAVFYVGGIDGGDISIVLTINQSIQILFLKKYLSPFLNVYC